jgi:organic hydroperoxide reductase OsmC/OhrA
VSVRFQAEKHSIELGSVEVAAEASPDRGSVESLSARVTLETNAPEDLLDRIVRTAERGCHVSTAITPEIPLEVTWTRAS